MDNHLKTIYKSVIEKTLYGRYISLKHIEPLINNLSDTFFKVSVLGSSVLKKPIYHIECGNGPKRILMWSQMHGNESTTTKALFDFFNYIQQDKSLFKDFRFSIIPILNPDGAEKYTRFNANNMDLNRDAQNLSQPESMLFKNHYTAFKPHFCFNLHGQRTIFSAGNANNVATLSFLAPAMNKMRSINPVRQQSMRLIASLNTDLQKLIPNQIGRYDDGFNANCVGDTLTMQDIPTILFEAGHYKNDYNREEVRYFVFEALIKVLKAIKNNIQEIGNHQDYFNIPENEKLFCDVIIFNALVNGNLKEIQIQFEEYLENNRIKFRGIVAAISNKSSKYAHKYIDAKGCTILNNDGLELEIGLTASFVVINDTKTLLISE